LKDLDMKKTDNEKTAGAAATVPEAGIHPAEADRGAGGDPAKVNETNSTTDDLDAVNRHAIAGTGSIADMVANQVEANDGFDPLTHAVNPDGTPKRKVDGSYALKRGRKSGATPTTNSAPAQSVQTPTINVDEASRQSCNMLINGAVLLFGEQWAPQDKEEAKGLQVSFKNYFEARGVPNVPPEIGLVVAVLAYSLPRLTHEKTVSRFTVLKMRAYEIWSAIRGK
jgi:hypothetical protein